MGETPLASRGRKALLALITIACSPHAAPPTTEPQPEPARYLYVWAGDKDEQSSDFLAVIDVQRESPRYGEVLATEPVGMSGTLPHHLEYELPAPGRLLFANGHHHEQLFLFDTEQPEHPRLVRTVPPTPPFRYPHDIVRLPNGHVLVGYLRGEGTSPVPGDTTRPGGHGGIAELDGEGRVIRTAGAADSSIRAPIRPYSFALLPAIDRLVVTSAPMMEDTTADVVQIWRLSDYSLLQTLQVPAAGLAAGGVLPRGHQYPFEPRVMPDGTVLLNAYGCGFYQVTDIATAEPKIRNVYTVDVPSRRLGSCGVPVVLGHFWVMTVGEMNMLADSTFRPHWLASDPGSDRLIVGAENGGETRMLMARLDASSGRLRWDESLRSTDGQLGISFQRERWPHGATGEAFGHAALFRP